MRCIICNNVCKFFLLKKHNNPPFDEFMRDIGPVEYFKCVNCGFVISKTHGEISIEAFEKLNSAFHQYLEENKANHKINQPPYAEQALMLSLLSVNNIIAIENSIDYAAGYGTLSRILGKYYKINMPISDPYVEMNGAGNYIYKSDLKKYKTVINSAMFEHVLCREDLDFVNDIVDEDGCLIIHTLVCENIPNDADWFYFEPPVHTAFHTNKSMEILMRQWNYNSSIYCPRSKCWILIREDNKEIEAKLLRINQELQCDWFYWKRGFVDYWK